MSYLEIIKELEKSFSGRLNGKSLPNDVSRQSPTACPQTSTEYEKYEIDEKTQPASSTVSVEPNATPLGAKRKSLTIDDIPELQRTFELSGWLVERRGNELICRRGTQRKSRT